jgi:hypothetical protein
MCLDRSSLRVLFSCANGSVVCTSGGGNQEGNKKEEQAQSQALS